MKKLLWSLAIILKSTLRTSVPTPCEKNEELLHENTVLYHLEKLNLE